MTNNIPAFHPQRLQRLLAWLRATLRPGRRWFALIVFALALLLGIAVSALWLRTHSAQPAPSTVNPAIATDPQHPPLPAPMAGDLSALPAALPAGPNAAYIKPTPVEPTVEASDTTTNPTTTAHDPDGSSSESTATGDSEPQVIERSQPDYPIEALREHEEGEVRLQIALDALGTVEDVRMIHSSRSQSLDRAAMDAARSWRFRPARRAGAAVSGLIEVPVEFRLDEH